jgi:hypothetical protein
MFVVGPDTTLTINGGCELDVSASVKAMVGQNSTIKVDFHRPLVPRT